MSPRVTGLNSANLAIDAVTLAQKAGIQGCWWAKITLQWLGCLQGHCAASELVTKHSADSGPDSSFSQLLSTCNLIVYHSLSSFLLLYMSLALTIACRKQNPQAQIINVPNQLHYMYGKHTVLIWGQSRKYLSKFMWLISNWHMWMPLFYSDYIVFIKVCLKCFEIMFIILV